MSEAVLAPKQLAKSAADRFLSSTAVLWFFALIVGQWVFLNYVVSFYGASTLTGDFAAWNQNSFLRKGYIAGDRAGNLSFAAHVTFAAVITFGGALQFIPQIRARAPYIHRWNGRIFMLAAAIITASGLYMVFIRGAGADAVETIANSLNAILIFFFAGAAWATARARDFVSHRRWALRTFMVANGVFFIRLGTTAWFALSGGAPGALTMHIFYFASYLFPLAVLELYLHAKENGGARIQLVASGVLLASTAYMSLGTFIFYMFVTPEIVGALK